jgi:hypothetical protein
VFKLFHKVTRISLLEQSKGMSQLFRVSTIPRKGTQNGIGRANEIIDSRW